MNNCWLVWSSGMKICLTWRFLTCRDVSLARERLTDVTLHFYGSRHEFRVCISSLDMIGRGVTWERIQLHSKVNHVGTGLTCPSSHGVTCKSESLQI